MTGLFYFDICAVVIVAIIICSLFFRKLTSGRTNVVYLMLLVCVLVTSISDLLASLYGNVIPISDKNYTIRFAINMVYFLARNLTAPIYILYIFSFMGIWHIYVKNHTKFVLWFMPYFISAFLILSNPFTKAVFYFGPNGEYCRGKGLYVLYVWAAFYLFFGFAVLFKYKKLVATDKFYALFSQYPVSIFTIVIQYIFPDILIEMFGTSIVMLLIYSMVQRAEEIVDPVSGVQNYNAALTNIKQSFEMDKEFKIIYITLTNCSSLRTYLGLDNFNEMLRVIGIQITKECNAHRLHGDVYYLLNGIFAIITEEKDFESIYDTANSIVSYLSKPLEIGIFVADIVAKSCIVSCPDDIDGYAGVVNFENTFTQKIPDSSKVVLLSEIADSIDFKLKNDLDSIINKAISEHNFRMYYQPIYSTEKMKFVSAEALIRLIDDKYGFVSPALFIPAAEKSGAIHEIGDYVLEEVCNFLEKCDMKKLGIDYVDINLSVAQCVEADLVQKVRNALARHNLDVNSIYLEITETAADFDPTMVDKNVKALANSGIHFSLDDYGTGYSNIKRVTSLPFSMVKLDKSFVDEMDDPMMWIVIKNTVNMLHEMKKEILVEGVEEARTFDRFRDLGCEYIQGYYFSKPLPADEFIKFMKEQNK